MNKLKMILKKELKNLKPAYLIYGEDSYLVDNFVDKIIDKFSTDNKDLEIIHLDDTEDEFLYKLNKAVTTISLMAKRKFIVVSCKKYFISKQKEDDVISKILNKLNSEVNLLIMIKGKIDKRIGIVKDLRKIGELICLKPPKYQQLNKWINKKFKERGKTIDRKSVKLLEHLFNNQLQRLDSEIEKICVYNINKHDLVYDDITDVISRDRMLEDNVIFSFIDKLCIRQKKEALILLKEMLKNGEVSLRILSNIIWQIKLLIQVKELKNKGNNIKQIAGILRQHPYPVEKAYKKCNNFKEVELEIILERLLQANVDIVYGKYSSPELALEMMINDII